VRSFKPFLPLLNIVIGKGTNEPETSLKPYRLCGVDKRPIPIKTGIDTSMNTVESIMKPERHDVILQLILIAFCP
jgi:hypothetical protein